MTDEMILELIRSSRQEEGFRHLVVRYQERLYQMIRRQTGNHEDTDDVLQNTFIKAFRHIHRFEGRSGLYTWLYRIASNEVINHRNHARKTATIDFENQDHLTAEPFSNTEGLLQRLEKVVEGLPERQQMVFRMRYYDELSYKEMAELLDVTEGALKASYHHAVKKIEEDFRAKQIL